MQVVIYLAMEMSLYLASTALIGLCLGWLVWGQSRRRQIGKVRSEMTAAFEAERSRAEEASLELQDADAKLDRLLEAERISAAKILTETRELLETEKQAARQSRMEVGQLRVDMDEAINVEKASASHAIQEAMREAEKEKTAAYNAEIRETQVRSELEELRLMAGAEKLAAQSARAELNQMRMEMQQALDAERDVSTQARRALDDIRGTLARTFGEPTSVITSVDVPPESLASEMADEPKTITVDEHDYDDDLFDGLDDFNESAEPAAFDTTAVLSGIDLEPGLAFDVQDETASSMNGAGQHGAPADIDDSNPDPAGERSNPVNGEDQQPSEQPVESSEPTPQLHLLKPSDGQTSASNGTGNLSRPSSLYEKRPDDVDALQEIDGIDSDTETLLNEQGCYQFKQLAEFSEDDVEWLAQTTTSMPDLRERMERDGWPEQARELQDKKYVAMNAERPRWWSRRRLR